MNLTKRDYQKLADQIDLLYSGPQTAELEKNGEVLSIDVVYEEKGYYEDDAFSGYMKGTGAWVCIDKFVSIEKCESYDENGNKTENNFDSNTFRDVITN